MGCREEVVAAARAFVARAGQDSFGVMDIVRETECRGSDFAESTIRTHIVSRMCGNAPDHHGTTYDDLERIDRNTYRLK